MRLCGLLLLLPAVFLPMLSANKQYSVSLCQQWCYKYDNYGAIYLRCCDYKERYGSCPSGCLFGVGANVDNIQCYHDENCPMGYKCCADSCAYNRRICKPIAHNTICLYPETTTTTTTPNISETTLPASTQKTTMVTDDEDYGDFSGSGGGIIEPEPIPTTTTTQRTTETEPTSEETTAKPTETTEAETTLETTTETEINTIPPLTTSLPETTTTSPTEPITTTTRRPDPTTTTTSLPETTTDGDDYDYGSGTILPEVADQPYSDDEDYYGNDDFSFDL